MSDLSSLSDAELTGLYKQHNPEASRGFFGTMIDNAKSGVQNLQDVADGNFRDIKDSAMPGPKTQSLADKLLKGMNDDPTILNIIKSSANNIGDTKPSDFSGALLETFGGTPEGKILSGLAGLNPTWNAVSTGVSKYANPAISKVTGINPDNLALMELVGGTAGFKKAGNITDPTLDAIKYASNKMGEGSGVSTTSALAGIPSLVNAVTGGGKNIYKGLKAPDIEELTSAADTIKQSSSEAYQTMRDVGATLTPEATQGLLESVNSAIAKTGKNNARLHGDTLSVLGDLKDTVGVTEDSPIAQIGISLEELDQFRQLLNDVVSKNLVNGKPDMKKALTAINAIDDHVDALTTKDLSSGDASALDALNFGRQEWRRASKFNTITNLLQQADGDPNKLKTSLFKFVNDPKKTRGFTEDELIPLRKAAKSSIGYKLLRTVGKFGIDLGGDSGRGNTLIPAMAGFGVGAGGLDGGMLVGAGTLAKQAQKLGTRGQVQDALDAIAHPPTPTARKTLSLPAPKAQLALPAPSEALSPVYGSTLSATESKFSPKDLIPAIGMQPASKDLSKIPDSELLKMYGDTQKAPDTNDVFNPVDSLPSDIKKDEGLKHSVYYDATGNKTVGYGFNMDSGIAKRAWKTAGIPVPFDAVYSGNAAISDAHAQALGNTSFNIATQDASDIYKDLGRLSQSRQEALLNLSYQLGKPTLQKFKSFNSAVNRGAWPEAVRYLLKSDYAQQAPGRAREVARKLLRNS